MVAIMKEIHIKAEDNFSGDSIDFLERERNSSQNIRKGSIKK